MIIPAKMKIIIKIGKLQYDKNVYNNNNNNNNNNNKKKKKKKKFC
jgi:hypothetical protein